MVRKMTSHTLNTAVQVLLFVYTPVARKLFPNCQEYLITDLDGKLWGRVELGMVLRGIIYLCKCGFPGSIVYCGIEIKHAHYRVGFLYESLHRLGTV